MKIVNKGTKIQIALLKAARTWQVYQSHSAEEIISHINSKLIEYKGRINVDDNNSIVIEFDSEEDESIFILTWI